MNMRISQRDLERIKSKAMERVFPINRKAL